MLLTYDNNEENMLGPHMENYTFALSPISLNKSNQQSKFIPITIIQNIPPKQTTHSSYTFSNFVILVDS